MTHLINFTNTVFFKVQKGEAAPQFELFLDEGLSHLSESLCGFGQSGGNVYFVNSYLKESENYSFCASDVFGREDSTQRRGAVCLFLYWLFQKAGGASWNEDGSITDGGGISFLHSLIQNYEKDWNSLGLYFNKLSDLIYKEFCTEMYLNKISEIFDFDLIDPATKERIFECEEFYKISVSDYKILQKMIPYSFVIFEKNDAESCKINCSGINGNFYVLY
jgi:hypothetical protein